MTTVSRRKALKLRSLDAAFTLASIPTSLLDLSVLASTKGSHSYWNSILVRVDFYRKVIMLTLPRLLPLIALVKPATLIVESILTINAIHRPILYPDFDAENGVGGSSYSENL